MMEFSIVDGIPHVDGVAKTPEEIDALVQAQAAIDVAEQNAALNATLETHDALADALALASLYPAPTPEENAIIVSQVTSALASFRELQAPPADIVALASALVSWKSEL